MSEQALLEAADAIQMQDPDYDFYETPSASESRPQKTEITTDEDGKPVGLSLEEAADTINYKIEQAELAALPDEPVVEEYSPEAEDISGEYKPSEPVVQAYTQLTEREQQFQQSWAEVQQAKSSEKMKRLRTEDPAEFAAYNAQLIELENNLQSQYQQHQAESQNLQDYVSKEHTSQLQKVVEVERRKLSRMVDGGWSDSRAQKLRNYLLEKGYTEQQLEQVRDAKTAALAWNSMQAEKGKLPSSGKRKSLPRRKSLKKRNLQEKMKQGRVSGTSVRAAGMKLEEMFS